MIQLRAGPLREAQKVMSVRTPRPLSAKPQVPDQAGKAVAWPNELERVALGGCSLMGHGIAKAFEVPGLPAIVIGGGGITTGLVPIGEGVANYTGPESCGFGSNVRAEALTGERGRAGVRAEY